MLSSRRFVRREVIGYFGGDMETRIGVLNVTRKVRIDATAARVWVARLNSVLKMMVKRVFLVEKF
jgi:hypothetical protein